MSTVPQQHHLAVDAHTLREAIDAHQRYLAGRSGGRRLNLTYADLANCSPVSYTHLTLPTKRIV